MAEYPKTGSILGSNIHTGLSTQILIVAGNNQPVGAVQDLTINQNRGLYKSKEIGLDGILEIVPNSATEFSATINRIYFDGLRLPEAFARGFINIKSQVVPFDILIIDTSRGSDEESKIVHRLTNCWFATYSPAYRASDFIITESATIQIEDISTTFGDSNESPVNGGYRGVEYQVNERERATDTGSGGLVRGAGYRGTLDVADLINQTFE